MTCPRHIANQLYFPPTSMIGSEMYMWLHVSQRNALAGVSQKETFVLLPCTRSELVVRDSAAIWRAPGESCFEVGAIIKPRERERETESQWHNGSLWSNSAWSQTYPWLFQFGELVNYLPAEKFVLGNLSLAIRRSPAGKLSSPTSQFSLHILLTLLIVKLIDEKNECALMSINTEIS